jgi:hypothetical protein
VIGGTEENDENPEDKRYPSKDSNPVPPEYESGTLPTDRNVTIPSAYLSTGSLFIKTSNLLLSVLEGNREMSYEPNFK